MVMALSHASCSCPAASSMVFVRQVSWRPGCRPVYTRAALRGAATSYAGGARVGATSTLAPCAPGCRTDVHSVAGNPKLDLFDSGSVELPPLTRRRWHLGGVPGTSQRRLSRGRAARRGGVAPEDARAARSTSTLLRTYTQPKISRGERHRAADAVAGGRGADGVRPGPPRGRPASPPTTAGPHRRGGRLLPSGLPTVTQSSGPSLPHVHGQYRPLSRVSLSVERVSLILREPGSLVVILRA